MFICLITIVYQITIDHVTQKLHQIQRKSGQNGNKYIFNQFAPEGVYTRQKMLCRRSETVLTRILIFACSDGRLDNTPLRGMT